MSYAYFHRSGKMRHPELRPMADSLLSVELQRERWSHDPCSWTKGSQIKQRRARPEATLPRNWGVKPDHDRRYERADDEVAAIARLGDSLIGRRTMATATPRRSTRFPITAMCPGFRMTKSGPRPA